MRFQYEITPQQVAEVAGKQPFLPEDYLPILEFQTKTDVPLKADLLILSTSVSYADYCKFLALHEPGNQAASESLGKGIDALTTIAMRLRDRLTVLGLRLIEAAEQNVNAASSQTKMQSLRRELGALMESPTIAYEHSGYRIFGSESGGYDTSQLGYGITGSPALQWYGPWEDVGAKLKRYLEQ